MSHYGITDRRAGAVAGIALAALLGASPAGAGTGTHAAAGHGGECDLGLHFTEEAERQAGGALAAAGHGDGHGTAAHAAADGEAHRVHTPQAGGWQLFMAPNKLHHLEPVYSETCGLRVVVYNAYTKPIRAARFIAFAKVIPSLESEAEHTRFLTPSADGSVLEAALEPELTRPFEIELYVRFPDRDEPQQFNVLIPAPE